MKPFVFDITQSPETVFSALQALPYSLWLDSADKSHSRAKYSFIAAVPVETIEAQGRKVTISNANQQTVLTGDVFSILKERLAAWKTETTTLPGLPPFQGGLAGFFSYDLARTIENMPSTLKADGGMPDMAFGIYDKVFAFDHVQDKGWLIIHAADQAEAERVHKFMMKKIADNAVEPDFETGSPLQWRTNFSANAYRHKIEKILEYIRAGDIFQANLSQRFEAILPQGFDAFAHYMNLREVNPTPFATYMNLGNVKISSASPEQFITVRNRKVETRPIKGTWARGETPSEDEVNKQALLASEKDHAENIMIVDLLRNDLSKVCEPASVEVHDLCKLESFASVHHLVSTVTGTLKQDQSPLDLMRGCFPGGSISGAPKIRAMEIIEECELARRGAYCGSIAYIGFDGTMDSNLLIRTLLYQNNMVSLNCGGGITADSVPEDEYQETLDKAEAIFRSFVRSAGKVRAA